MSGYSRVVPERTIRIAAVCIMDAKFIHEHQNTKFRE